MPKVLTIGSALIDIFIRSPHFAVDAEGSLTAQASGGKLAVDSFSLKSGGGASNTAVGFARMGFQACILSETGRDELAQLVMSDLQREQVDTSRIIQEKKEETGGSVLLIDSDTGDRTALTHRGASSKLDPHDLPADLAEFDVIHISSVSGQTHTLQQIFETASKSIISWNPGTPDIEALITGDVSLSRPIHFFCVNRQEWAMLASKQRELLQLAQIVVVTDGVNGGEVYQGGQRVTGYEVEAVKAVDSTGAGDAFVVGFLSALLQGRTLLEALEWGKKNAASVVQHLGAKAGLLKINELATHV